MWSVCSMTALATFEGVLILRSAPTAPPRRDGPCMQLASSSTTPSSFGSPPYPTLVSRGSSSTMFTPAITASSVSPPPLMVSTALAQQLIPPLLRFALEIAMIFGRPWAAIFWTIGTAAAPSMMVRRVRLVIYDLLLICVHLRSEKKIADRRYTQINADAFHLLHFPL